MSATLEDWEFRIAKLELARGDILVVKGPNPPRWEALQVLVPQGVRVCYIPPEVDFFVLSRAEIEERAKPIEAMKP